MIELHSWKNPQEDIKMLLSALWDVENFCMLDVKESATIAYILDRAYENYTSEQYKEIVENLWTWATNSTWNQFSFEVAFTTVLLMVSDETIDEIDKQRANQRYEQIVSDYKLKKATSFWMLDEKYAPE